MQSITPNLKFILGWLKSLAFRRSEVRHAGERLHPGDGQGPSYRWKTVSSLKRTGWTPVFTGVTIRLGFRRNDGWRVTFQATK
jgi:hypothetical protein